MSAYSQLRLTSDLNQNLRPLAGTGSVAERTIRERQAELQIARAEYRSVREKSAFDASQAEFQARADVADAERLLKIARQQLETLLGYPEPEVDMDSQPSLSRLELRAPFEGTIESRSMARSERVERGDPLFILADTTSLYIAADIRENDWPAISLQTGTKIEVSVPAIPDRTFTATVHYIGRQVVPETNAVPLVATINNVDGLLRPGMFVRVSLPLGPPRNALAVHPESVVQHEDQEFVFVAVTETSFRRADVTTGLTSDEWTEVTSGLTAGDHVIEHGAFLLKSELLLEGEE